MRRLLLPLLLLASAAATSAFAEDKKKDLFKGSFSLGFSYPLVVSASLGTMLPLGKEEHDYVIAETVSLRLDGELGLGGGSVGAGVFVPTDYVAVSVKAVRLRTWLLTWNEEKDRTFDGGVIEFALPSPHGGPKIGIGSFKDREPLNGTRDKFTYVFIGVGW